MKSIWQGKGASISTTYEGAAHSLLSLRAVGNVKFMTLIRGEVLESPRRPLSILKILRLTSNLGSSRDGGRGPRHGAGVGANISFPPPRNLEGAQGKHCKNTRNSITPNIPLVEAGHARKIGASRLPKGPRRFRGPRKLACPSLENAFRRHWGEGQVKVQILTFLYDEA